MCGFIGGVSKTPIRNNSFSKANKHIICRGPDKNLYINNAKNLIDINIEKYFHFEFNRLSILDLTDEADQPMYSNESTDLIMFNGEIFNHAELRKELESEGIKFKTSHSDTEVILKGLSTYGPKFIEKLNGQFAIFFLNSKQKKAYLIRDRLGQKPLYYYISGNKFLFSSNFISIKELIDDYQINEESLNNYLNTGVVPTEKTLIKNILEVKPSEIVEIDLSNLEILTKQIYWDINNISNDTPFDEKQFFSLFHDAVKIRQSADVPVAYFLSGGIDSTSILKSAFESSKEILNSFSAIHSNNKYDESYWSSKAANQYNTFHTTEIIEDNISFESINNALSSIDQPYFDPSVVPSYLLSNKISKHYKVAISGDGGDELLGGYQRVIKTNNINFKSNVSKLIFSLYPSILGTGNKILRYSKNTADAYWSFHEDRKLLNLLNLKPDLTYREQFSANLKDQNLKNIMISDYKFFLSEMMLFKVDRTSMANSLEVRSPFLDYRLVEYVLGSNLNFINTNNPKQILKDYLSEDFNNEFLYRKKQGFVFNVEDWVYDNIDYIASELKDSTIIKEYNKNILRDLSLFKTRMNGIRIWKLFVLENFMKRL